MHIESLTLNNYGPFKGTHQITFGWARTGRVNVICAPSGFGKTALIQSIGWPLGFGATSLERDRCFSTRSLHQDALRTSVTLRFSLGGNRYESFSQHWPSTAGADEPDFVELSEQKTVNDPPQRLEKPRHHLKAMLPAPVHKVLLASDPEKLQQQSLTHADALGIREFVQWAKTRDRGGYGDPAAQRAQFALSAIFEGHEPNEATGILGLVGLYLQALFRDWIQEGQSLPLSFRHLAGEELPWLLDCPFAAMDNLCRSAAADVLASLKAQIIMAVTPEEFKGPVEQTLSGQLNRLTLPRTAAFQRQYQHSD